MVVMAFMTAMVVPTGGFVVAHGNALALIWRDHSTSPRYFGRSTDEQSSQVMPIGRPGVIVSV